MILDSRKRMQNYWVTHSVKASMEEMLLDTNANVISDNELPEILQLLPSFKSKTVLELGAGIGYYFDFKVFLKVNHFFLLKDALQLSWRKKQRK